MEVRRVKVESQPLEGVEEADGVVVLLHLAVAREGVGRHLGQTKLAPSNGLLALLTLGRPLAVVDGKPVVSHRAVPKQLSSTETRDWQRTRFKSRPTFPGFVSGITFNRTETERDSSFDLQQFTFSLANVQCDRMCCMKI